MSVVKVIHWPSSKVTQIQHFQTSFAQKTLGWLKPNFIWSLHGMWGMKICSNVPGQMTMPIYGEKISKIFFGTKRLMTLKLGIQHWVLEYYQCFHMITLGWPWPFLWQDQICFRMLLHEWKLIQHWVLMYFQVCSNSAYPQHSGERYRTNGTLVYYIWQCHYWYHLKWNMSHFFELMILKYTYNTL